MWPFKKKYREIIPEGFMVVSYKSHSTDGEDYAFENTKYFNSIEDANKHAERELKKGASIEIWKLEVRRDNEL